MCRNDFSQRSALREHGLKQRIVIDQIHRSGMAAQRLLQVPKHLPHSRFGERIEEKKHERLLGKLECGRVAADRLQPETFLRFALVLPQVLLCDVMQGQKEFHSNDPAEGIVRCHQERTSFSGTEIDEGEVAEVEYSLIRI